MTLASYVNLSEPQGLTWGKDNATGSHTRGTYMEGLGSARYKPDTEEDTIVLAVVTFRFQANPADSFSAAQRVGHGPVSGTRQEMRIGFRNFCSNVSEWLSTCPI